MSEQPIDTCMEKIVSLCKRRGFVFQSSEIYGGFNGFWDYGPYGIALKRAVERQWWLYMVEKRNNVVGLDSSIICHPKVWKASGHVDRFGDIMCDCKKCKTRFRVDQMPDPTTCTNCGSKDLTPPREFNLMMKTYVGPVFDEEHIAYLRAETCQPIFLDFHSIRIATRMQLPFGIAQVGKAFRNEITPRMFTFRSREFSQMEMEFFCADEGSMEWFEYWRQERWNFYLNVLKFPVEKLHLHPHDKLAHYAKAAVDIEYEFPFGWGELEGIHHRGTWDMSQHQQFSEQDLQYLDQSNNTRYLPTVVETSVGLDRMVGRRPRGAPLPRHGRPGPGRVPSALQEAQPERAGAPGKVPRPLPHRVGRDREHRQALPPSGRNRHAVLRHVRLRFARRQRRDRARTRLDGAGTHSDRRTARLPRRKGARLI